MSATYFCPRPAEQLSHVGTEIRFRKIWWNNCRFANVQKSPNELILHLLIVYCFTSDENNVIYGTNFVFTLYVRNVCRFVSKFKFVNSVMLHLFLIDHVFQLGFYGFKPIQLT